MARTRLGAVFAVVRLDDPGIDDQDVTVKEVVSTEEGAVAEVERLTEIRRGDSRYGWQATRWIETTPPDDASEPRLALTDPLDPWELTLRSGEVLTIQAHGVKEEDGTYVFVALMHGDPHFELELARIPMALVAELEGG
jgi:hypothetical protein